MLKGAAVTLLGAILFSAKGVFVKLALEYGVSAEAVLFWRMAFAAPFFGFILIRAELEAPTPAAQWRKFFPRILLLGLAGYYLASLFDFLGLALLSAGLERIILYTYPTMVLALSAAFSAAKPRPLEWIASGLVYAGLLLVFGDELVALASYLANARAGSAASAMATNSIVVAAAVDPAEANQNTLLGGMLVLASAICYAVYLFGSQTPIRALGTRRYNSAALLVSSAAVLLHGALASNPLTGWAWQVYALAAAMAVLSTVIPSFCVAYGIQRLGSSQSTVIGAIGPVAAMALGGIILSEDYKSIQWAGSAVVVVASVFLALRSVQSARPL